ncbi:unnamed protein product, partial [Linum tenue]
SSARASFLSLSTFTLKPKKIQSTSSIDLIHCCLQVRFRSTRAEFTASVLVVHCIFSLQLR